MPASEIDDIFASKGKASHVSSVKASSSSSLSSEKKKRKKGKDKEKSAKRKRESVEYEDDAAPSKPTKRPVPETVFDTSVAPPPAKKSQSAKAGKIPSAVVKQKKPKGDREEEQRFKDSRGTGPRRKTEEGFSIYKEDELGITEQGGDTPLCPFDCQCCF